MARSLQHLVIITPLLAVSPLLWSADRAEPAGAFGFDRAEFDAIQYTRSGSDLAGIRSDLAEDFRPVPGLTSRQTEFSFKLKPKRPDFSRSGGYGLRLFTAPHFDVQSRLIGPARLNEAIDHLNVGFEYSAGVRIEHDDEDIDGTAYVSSSLLGVSYGRLGRLWYGGIDVNLEQFVDDQFGAQNTGVLSLDVTTGRRLGFTGLTTHSPLWLLSVQGNFEVSDNSTGEELDADADWFLNPSLFWQQPGFTFSAQMQVPVEFETLDDEGEPDYRLRAVFEKQFK